MKNTQECLQRINASSLRCIQCLDLQKTGTWSFLTKHLVFTSNCSKTLLSTFHRCHRMCCLELHQSVFHFFSTTSSHCLKHCSCCCLVAQQRPLHCLLIAACSCNARKINLNRSCITWQSHIGEASICASNLIKPSKKKCPNPVGWPPTES